MLNKYIGTIFPTDLLTSCLSPFGNSHNISSHFIIIIFVFLICDQCFLVFSSVQFSSVAQSCPTLCDTMNHSMPGLPVHHQLLVFSQTYVDRVSDAIQPSHPLLSPSPPVPNPSQHPMLWPPHVKSFLMLLPNKGLDDG